MSRKLIIAVDGPAGAGKSTIAQRLAADLGYVNLETGAMYRALGLKALEHGVSLDDETALHALALTSHIDLHPTANGNIVLLDGRDVSALVREPRITDAASRVSVHPRVREWMVARQREMGASGGVIMEGRDIGTAVFPQAEVKIFLDANPNVRAERRLIQRGLSPADDAEAQRVAAAIRERDERDRQRAASPLEAAQDAVIIDSSRLTIDQVVDRIKQLVAARS